MRIIYDFNEFPEVEEITTLSGTPGWKPGSDTNKNPDALTLFVVRAGEERGDCVGEWILDGTPEAYQAAKQNYMEIVEKVLVNGFVRASDFNSFEWW